MTSARSRLALAFVVTLILTALIATPAWAFPDYFRGRWVSTDTDGSSQRLVIGGGSGGGYGTYTLNYYDDGASVCGLDPETGDFLHAAQARGFGEALPGTGVLEGTWDIYCMTSPPTLVLDDFPFTFSFDDFTLVDDFGVVWTRIW